MARQVNQHDLDTHPSTNHCNYSNQDLHGNHNLHDDDAAVFIAATQLLELSRRNGVTRPTHLYRAGSHKRHNSSSREEVMMTGAVNGLGEEEKEVVHEGEESGEGGKREEMEVEGGENGEMVEGGENGDGGEGEVQMKEETRSEEGSVDTSTDRLCGKILSGVSEGMLGILVNSTAPDTSLLHPGLVHLLASQRLQQLFGHRHDDNDEKTTGTPPPQSNHSVGKGINGICSVLFPQSAKPTPSPGR